MLNPPNAPSLLRAACVVCALILAGCSSSDAEGASLAADSASAEVEQSTTTVAVDPTTAAPATTTVPTTTTAPTTISPEEVEQAFNGRPVPQTPSTVDEAISQFISVQDGLRAEGSTQDDWADLGHTEQLIVRTLLRQPDWQEQFIASLPDDYSRIAELHLEARTELGLLHSGGVVSERVPGWRIVDPEPLDVLVSHYQRGAEETGIEWEVLAGINLIETVMGRIDGVSSAGALGPMQFLPTTWPEVSQGGDVLDPADAIPGAARYLVQRGGLDDIRAGLWGYNNSDHYGNAVLAYAEMVRFDERSLRGFYNWEVYVGSAEGTLWLPVGFDEPEPRSAADYLAENPWASTLG